LSTPDDILDDASPPPVEGGRVTGRVTDFDGNPLVGVRVEAATYGGADLEHLPVLTDGNGDFRLEGLEEGQRYDLRFVLGRVRARTLSVPVGTEDLVVQLARPQGILLVAKTAADQPSPDVLHVRLEREGAHGVVREYEGRHLTMRMLLWSIRPGTYTLTVWGGGYVPVQAHGVQVKEGRAAPEVQILLSVQGGTIRGHVRDAQGKPVERALFAWRPLVGAALWPRHECGGETGEGGTFVIRGLPTGRYLLSTGRPSGPFVDLEVEIAEERSIEVELLLP